MAMHPRLNFDQFQKERKQRAKRRAILWASAILSAILLIALLSRAQTTDRASELPVPMQAPKLAPTQQVPPTVQQQFNVHALESPGSAQVSSSIRATAAISPKSTTYYKPTEVAVPVASSTAIFANLAPAKADTTDYATVEAALIKSAGDSVHSPEIEQPRGGAEEKLAHEALRPNGHQIPILLSLEWLPYHSPIASPEEGRYVSLNSVQLGVSVPLTNWNQLKISANPSVLYSRYQFQHEYSWEGNLYAPGSIVGYRQVLSGFEPVIADSVRGVFTRVLRENGAITETFLPVGIQLPLFYRHDVEASLGAEAGLRVLMGARGSWYTSNSVNPVSESILPQGISLHPFVTSQFRISYSTAHLQWFTQLKAAWHPSENVALSQSRIFTSVGVSYSL